MQARKTTNEVIYTDIDVVRAMSVNHQPDDIRVHVPFHEGEYVLVRSRERHLRGGLQLVGMPINKKHEGALEIELEKNPCVPPMQAYQLKGSSSPWD